MGGEIEGRKLGRMIASTDLRGGVLLVYTVSVCAWYSFAVTCAS